MSIKFEMSIKDLGDLQLHMEQLLEYYEADLIALGRIERHVNGDALKCLKKLEQKRLEQLENADYIFNIIVDRYIT